MKLHIGNLPKNVTDAELNDMLAAFAKPVTLDIIRDTTGVPKGFAFAEFSSDDEAKAVIAGCNGQQLGGQELTLAEARPRKRDAH